MPFTTALNKRYLALNPLDRLRLLFDSFPAHEILFTSSFGSSSSVLLHMVNKVCPGHPIYFVDTGYHFRETIKYKEQLKKQLELNIIETAAKPNKHKFTQTNSTYLHNQDLCCFINKVQPVNELKKNHNIWISGLLKHQNANRQSLNIFEKKADIIKFHPILDMTKDEVELYIYLHDLPKHALVGQGYSSIGCTHCTRKGVEREGRWAGTNKIECGLHV
ncbi:MAG: phosphoadenylyl-sulfate reductase [Bacteroidota bacterium]